MEKARAGIVAGALMLSGVTQFAACVALAEAIHPGNDMSLPLTGLLGSGPSEFILDPAVSWFYNPSSVVLGSCLVVSAYFLFRSYGSFGFSLLLALSGIGSIGVGLFSASRADLYTLSAFLEFPVTALTAVLSGFFQKSPYSLLSVALGVVSFAAIEVFATGGYGQLGPGGVQRVMAASLLLWMTAFGGYLVFSNRDALRAASPAGKTRA